MRVLLAYDGSAGAAEAAALTQAIPWPSDSVLRVVSVLEPILSPMSGPWDRGSVLSPDLDAAVTASANETLREVVQRLGSSVRSVDGSVLRGRAASVIVDDAREFRADLVIVGSRGHGAIATLLLGSVSSEVVDHAPCPVLVARGRSLSRVVFATDDSPSAQAAEAILAQWPIFAGLPIHVLSVAEVVHPWTTGIAPTMYGQVLDAYAAELRESKAQHQQIATIAATRLRESGRHVDSEMRDGDRRERSSPQRRSEAPTSSFSVPAAAPGSPASCLAASPEMCCQAVPHRFSSSTNQLRTHKTRNQLASRRQRIDLALNVSANEGRHVMNERQILVAYDGSEEAYWALMQAADTARAKGAAIGVVTVLPKLATAAADAAEILREHRARGHRAHANR